MSFLGVSIAYDGLQTSNHVMDMRRLGYAMVGLDHVITHGVVAVAERRLAKPRERFTFDVVSHAPTQGSLELIGGLYVAYQALQGTFPFILELMKDKCPELVWDWISLVFKSLGGREAEASVHMEKILDYMQSIHESEKIDREKERDFILKVIDRLAPHAQQVAVPVGEQAEKIKFKSLTGDGETEISVAEAAAIRSGEKLTVGDPYEVTLRIDGLIRHTNRGSVEFPDKLGTYVPAEIRDPLFMDSPNPYISSMNESNFINVRVVPSYRGDELRKLYVMQIIR